MLIDLLCVSFLKISALQVWSLGYGLGLLCTCLAYSEFFINLPCYLLDFFLSFCDQEKSKNYRKRKVSFFQACLGTFDFCDLGNRQGRKRQIPFIHPAPFTSYIKIHFYLYILKCYCYFFHMIFTLCLGEVHIFMYAHALPEPLTSNGMCLGSIHCKNMAFVHIII